MRLGLILTLVLPWLAAAALAREAPLIGLQTADQSKGWNAVGRLDLGRHGFCSGALIAPDLVLTAAHCLYDKNTGEKVAPKDIQFLAGLRNGRAEAYRRAAIAVTHPDYRPDHASDLDRVGNDIALIQLDQPIRQPSITAFATADTTGIGAEVGVGLLRAKSSRGALAARALPCDRRLDHGLGDVLRHRLWLFRRTGFCDAKRRRSDRFGDFRQGRGQGEKGGAGGRVAKTTPKSAGRIGQAEPAKPDGGQAHQHAFGRQGQRREIPETLALGQGLKPLPRLPKSKRSWDANHGPKDFPPCPSGKASPRRRPCLPDIA